MEIGSEFWNDMMFYVPGSKHQQAMEKCKKNTIISNYPLGLFSDT